MDAVTYVRTSTEEEDHPHPHPSFQLDSSNSPETTMKLKHRRCRFTRKFILFLLLIVTIITIIVYFSFYSLFNCVITPFPPNETVFLLWTSFFGKQMWTGDNAINDLSEYRCSTDCVVTRNRCHRSQAAAILFHWRDITVGDRPTKMPGEMFMLNNAEPPYLTGRHFGIWISWGHYDYIQENMDLYMNYRRDADIYNPYGEFVLKDELAPSQDWIKVMKSKNRSVAWMASNCKTLSKRESFVKGLQGHIDVDIYGKCGDLSCAKTTDNYCREMIANKYHFYLSFENSLCKDYVTEKVFYMMKYNVIPVVMGGSTGDLYDQLLPPGSFINALDFKDEQSLASYLKQVMSDPILYSSFFDWKTKYDVRTDSVLQHNICSLCTMFQDGKRPPPSNRSDFYSWWYDGGNCHSWPYHHLYVNKPQHIL